MIRSMETLGSPASSFFRLLSCIVIHPESGFAYINYFLGGSFSFFHKHISYNNGIRVSSVHYAPNLVSVRNTQLMAMRPD